jgi:hypothetical protein
MADQLPLHLTADGTRWRPLHDVDSYARGLMHNALGDQWISNFKVLYELGYTEQDIPHDPTTHMPEDDATYIAQCHKMMVNSKK